MANRRQILVKLVRKFLDIDMLNRLLWILGIFDYFSLNSSQFSIFVGKFLLLNLLFEALMSQLEASRILDFLEGSGMLFFEGSKSSVCKLIFSFFRGFEGLMDASL